MTHEPRLDDPAVDWLCSGPDRAPDWVFEGAVAHAEARPRRRLGMWVAARPLLGQLRLVRADEAFEARVPRTWPGAVAAGIAVVLLGGAFALGAGWAWGNLPAATPAPSATPVPPTAVSVAATCVRQVAAVERTTDGVTRSRGERYVCTAASPDARLAGTLTLDVSVDRRSDGTGDTWGDAALRTDGGLWAGAFSGSVEADGTWHTVGVLSGTGSYAGLHLVYSHDGAPAALALRGRLTNAAWPTGNGDVVVRRLACSSGAAGTESMDPSGVNHVQGRSMTCSTVASDPRLAGDLTLVAAIDAKSDDSASIGGTESMVTDSGVWTGTWAGTYDAGWTTHRWTGTVRGSGAFSGLEYRYRAIGEWPWFIEVGTIEDGR